MIREIIQTLMAMTGAMGFSILFNVRGKKLLAAAVGAGISWMVYLLTYEIYEDKVFSMLCATMVIGVLAEILARVMKAPVTILLVPMLIPLFPGSDLFYATSHMVQNHGEESSYYLDLVVKEAGTIAFGIILITCGVQVILKIVGHFKRTICEKKGEKNNLREK